MTPATTSLSELTLQSIRLQVNRYLQDYIATKTMAAEKVSPRYALLWNTIADVNLAGGKRLRPYITLLGYHCYGGKDADRLVPVAAAWELLHLCMLIHDDIVDNDLIRHGAPNVAGHYHGFYAEAGVPAEQQAHLASSAALLAGDLALSAAHEAVLLSDLSPADKLQVQQHLVEATFAVAGGELLDVESVLFPVDQADPLAVALYKTASYSFVGPLVSGAALGGATIVQLAELRSFGQALGCAFQIADDLLGVFGDPALTGKSNSGDLAEGKRTLLLQHAVAHASPEDGELLTTLVGKADLTPAEADAVRQAFVRSGAKQAGEHLLETYTNRSLQLLEAMELSADRERSMRELVAMATRRRH